MGGGVINGYTLSVCVERDHTDCVKERSVIKIYFLTTGSYVSVWIYFTQASRLKSVSDKKCQANKTCAIIITRPLIYWALVAYRGCSR